MRGSRFWCRLFSCHARNYHARLAVLVPAVFMSRTELPCPARCFGAACFYVTHGNTIGWAAGETRVQTRLVAIQMGVARAPVPVRVCNHPLLAGEYWIDPNEGCTKDASKVYCDFQKKATCVHPKQAKVPCLRRAIVCSLWGLQKPVHGPRVSVRAPHRSLAAFDFSDTSDQRQAANVDVRRRWYPSKASASRNDVDLANAMRCKIATCAGMAWARVPSICMVSPLDVSPELSDRNFRQPSQRLHLAF